jgi:phospholipase C
LPYEIQVHAVAAQGSVALQMINSGEAGVVLHVYDRLHLERVPRRYTIEAGKQLEDAWDAHADGGRYDLWLLGPNGFHRAFAGQADERVQGEIQASYDRASATLSLQLQNGGEVPLDFTITAYGYVDGGPWPTTVAPHGNAQVHWSLKGSGGWYDFTVAGPGGFLRRLAGRIETGAHGISDPLLGTA